MEPLKKKLHLTHFELTCHWYGKGTPKAVMISGFGTSLSLWEPLVKELLPYYGSVVVVALPLHEGGRVLSDAHPFNIVTFAEELTSALKQHGLNRYHLIAHSFGARIALAMALHRRPEVDQLYLIAPGGFYSGENWMFKTMSASWTKWCMDRSSLAHWFVKFLIPNAPTTKLAGYAKALRYLSADFSAIDLGKTGILAQLCNIKAGVTVIVGANDRLYPKEFALEIKQHFVKGQGITLEQSGHVPMRDNPTALAIVMMKCGVSSSFLPQSLSLE